MKISSRIVRGPLEGVIDKSLGVYLPSYDEIKTVIEDYQTIAIRRGNHKWSYGDLQIHLLISMQTEVKYLASLREIVPNPNERERYEAYLEMAKLPLNALRRIADGMAFRFLNRDMSLFQSLWGNKNSFSGLSDEGILHEISFASALNDHSDPDTQVFFCCLSDATNIGDVIVKTPAAYEIIEVKKGKSSRGRRISRQKERMEALTDFYDNETTEINGQKVQLLRLPTRRHRLKELETYLRKSEGSAPAIFDVSAFHFVWCCDSRDYSFRDLKKSMDEAKATADARFGTGQWLSMSSLEFRTKTGVTVPITNFPIAPDIIADLLLGGRIYVSYIHIEGLVGYIEGNGWQVVNLINESAADAANTNSLGTEYSIFHLFQSGNPNKNCTFHIDFLLEIAFELIEVDFILDVCLASTNCTGNWVPVYDDDQSLWI